MTKTETIKIQDGDTVIELTGETKKTFLAEQEAINVQINSVEAEYKAKRDARESAITKLGEIAGLTKEELDAIL